jgi:hypothetical protein
MYFTTVTESQGSTQNEVIAQKMWKKIDFEIQKL